LRILIIALLACVSACSWFGSRRAHVPDPTEIIVTGAPADSIVFVDGVQSAPAALLNDRPQVISVTSGAHIVEIHVGDAVVYREETYVGAGEHRMIRVLSGLHR
jgi:hypothetical protein